MIPNEDLIAEFMRNEKTAADVAKDLGISEYALSEWLKLPLTDARKEKIIEAIRK